MPTPIDYNGLAPPPPLNAQTGAVATPTYVAPTAPAPTPATGATSVPAYTAPTAPGMTSATDPTKVGNAATSAPIAGTKNIFNAFDDANGFDLKAAAGQMSGAATWNPNGGAMVSNQLNKLISSNSPYLQLARTRAAQEAASRGLLSSSIAAGAGEAAAIDRALPIAQQDAATRADAGRFNVENRNLFRRDQNNFMREGALNDQQAAFRKDEQGREIAGSAQARADEWKRRQTELGFQAGESATNFSRDLARLGYQGQLDAASKSMDMKFQSDTAATNYARELQSLGYKGNLDAAAKAMEMKFQSASDVASFSRELSKMGYASRLENSKLPISFSLAMAQQSQQAVQEILSNPDLSPAAKQGAIKNMIDYTNRSIDWAERFFGVRINNLEQIRPNAGEDAAGT